MTSDEHPLCSGDAMLPDAVGFVEMMGGDPNTALLILTTAENDLSALTSEFEKAFQMGDVAGLLRVLHSLRGSSSTLGADSLGACLLKWEQDLEQGRSAESLSWGEIQSVFRAYGKALAALRASVLGDK